MALNFKQGLKSNLPLTGAAAGTVYLTTDTGELFYDVDNVIGNRKQMNALSAQSLNIDGVNFLKWNTSDERWEASSLGGLGLFSTNVNTMFLTMHYDNSNNSPAIDGLNGLILRADGVNVANVNLSNFTFYSTPTYSSTPTSDNTLTNKAYVDGRTITLTNTTVATSAWTNSPDGNFEGYDYVATISNSDIDETFVPSVIFNLTDATSGIFCPLCETVEGGIRIRANAVPGTNTVIPTIVCIKG